MDHNKLWKILRHGNTGPPYLPLEKPVASQEATVRTGHGATTVPKLGKEYVKAVYCHPVYLHYMQSTSCEMVGWMMHKLESKFLREISTTSDVQMIPPYGRKQRGTEEPPGEGERGE